MSLPEPRWEVIDKKHRALRASHGRDYLDGELRNRFQIQLIYISSNLEGISVTWEDAAAIIENFPQPGAVDTSLPAIRQAIGQARALQLIERGASQHTVEPQSHFVKRLHYELMREVHPEDAGNYRDSHRLIAGSSVMTSIPITIAGEMATLSDDLVRTLSRIEFMSIRETVELAARAHHEITRIHPFTDGNGRVARLYLNFVVRRRGLPYVSLPKVGNDQPMNDVLKAADAGDLDPAVRLYGSLIEDSLDQVVAHYGVTGSGS